jgi:SAM-dependent methyltransferase
LKETTVDRSKGGVSISGCDVDSALAAYWDPPTQSAFEKLLPVTDKRVLIVGCGTNPIIQTFLSRGASVVALDLSPQALRFSRSAHPGANFLLADAQRLPLPAGVFDITWSVSTLQYMDSVEAVVSGCRNALRPGGRSVFIENLSRNPAARVDRLRRKVLKCTEQPTMRIRSHLETSSKQLFDGYYRNVEFRVWHSWTTLLFPIADSALPGTALVRSMIRKVAHPSSCTDWRARYGWIAEVVAIS